MHGGIPISALPAVPRTAGKQDRAWWYWIRGATVEKA